MKKTDVIEFFDTLAESWDDSAEKVAEKVSKILDVAEISEGKTVLDIACGTGILVPDYLARKVKKYIGVDISKKMIEVAKRKYAGYQNVEFLCDDAEILKLSEKVDSVVIYNAFPHFVDRVRVFENLSGCLKQGGRLTVAHGMSREALIAHHAGRAEAISTILPETEEMSELMKPFFEVDFKLSDENMYIVSGKLKG